MILFSEICLVLLAFNIIYGKKDCDIGSKCITQFSFMRIRKNAWDIVNDNHEFFNSSGEKSNKGEFNLSWYRWNITYDRPFSSQISQVILVLLIIILLICVILSLICCYYSVPKKEDFSKDEHGIYCFENEERPEEFYPIYEKNAEIRRYILTGETPNSKSIFPSQKRF